MTSLFATPSRDALPKHLSLAILLIPVLLLAQILLAGRSLFQDARPWAWHGTLGWAVALPISAVLVLAAIHRRTRPLRRDAAAMAALYGAQIAFIVAAPDGRAGLLEALHLFNAALLLTASLRVQKWRCAAIGAARWCSRCPSTAAHIGSASRARRTGSSGNRRRAAWRVRPAAGRAAWPGAGRRDSRGQFCGATSHEPRAAARPARCRRGFGWPDR